MIGFEFNGKVYSICITEAICFPQALAATAPVFKQLQLDTVAKAIVIDIGGFTADYLSLRYGAADWAACDSLENGVITLYNRLLSKIRADYDLLLEETDIDAILTGRSTEYGSEIQALVERGAESFVADLFRTLRERKIELRTGKVIFVGGGSLLLRKQIENSGKVQPSSWRRSAPTLPDTGSYTRPRKQIGEQYGREERRLPIHGAIQCRRPKSPAGSCHPERAGATQGTVPCQCRDPLHKLSRVSGGCNCAKNRSADSGTVGTRDINQYAAGNHTHNGEEYGQRYPTCHGIRKHPVRCRRHAGRRWLPFAPEFLGCDTAIGALINLLKHPSAAYLVVDAKK